MTEAWFGLLGVITGSAITWFHTFWTSKKALQRKARYLAIRVVCVLDKYVEDCVAVVKDNGLCYGSRTQEGYLVPQVSSPGAPVFPDDIDWKSINHDLMYEILSFPSDVETADGIIRAAWEIAYPPDYDEGFEERAFQYAQLGLRAYELAKNLRDAYQIPDRDYKGLNPASEMKNPAAS